jgi:hypothetical protein
VLFLAIGFSRAQPIIPTRMKGAPAIDNQGLSGINSSPVTVTKIAALRIKGHRLGFGRWI